MPALATAEGYNNKAFAVHMIQIKQCFYNNLCIPQAQSRQAGRAIGLSSRGEQSDFPAVRAIGLPGRAQKKCPAGAGQQVNLSYVIAHCLKSA
jgi:hypothetical protein